MMTIKNIFLSKIGKFSILFMLLCAIALPSVIFAKPQRKPIADNIGQTPPPPPMGGNREHPPRMISVDGSSDVDIVPDGAVFSVGIQGKSKKIEEAQKKNHDDTQKVLDILKKYNIEEKNISTVNYSIQPLYDYKDGQSVWQGYAVNTDLRVTIADLDSLPKVLDDLTENVMVINNVDFICSKSKDFQNQAISEAIKDAQKKAQYIAKKLGASLGDVMFVDTTYMGVTSNRPFASMLLGARSSKAPILPTGVLHLNANIKMSFALMPARPGESRDMNMTLHPLDKAGSKTQDNQNNIQ